MSKTLGEASDSFAFTPDESPVSDIIDIQNHELVSNHIKELAPYLAIAENIKEVNQFTAPQLLGKLSVGLRKAGDLLATAKYLYKKARADRKRVEAVVALDLFPEYAKQNDVKSTDAMRAYYVNQHKDVLAAIDREAFFEAVQEQLHTIKTELFMSITTARSIVYGFKDSNQLSAVATGSDD